MMHPPKKIAALILKAKPPGGTPPGGPGDGYGPEDHQAEIHRIAEELIHAMEAKSPEGVAQALSAFMDCIQEEDEQQDEADREGPEGT